MVGEAYSQTRGARGCGSPSSTTRALAPSQSNRFVNKPGIRALSFFKPFARCMVGQWPESPEPLPRGLGAALGEIILRLEPPFLPKASSSLSSDPQRASGFNLKQLTEPSALIARASSSLQDREKP
jgi:hypothetical protein